MYVVQNFIRSEYICKEKRKEGRKEGRGHGTGKSG